MIKELFITLIKGNYYLFNFNVLGKIAILIQVMSVCCTIYKGMPLYMTLGVTYWFCILNAFIYWVLKLTGSDLKGLE